MRSTPTSQAARFWLTSPTFAAAFDRAYLDALISRLDLDPTRRFRHYSRGNKQKVGLLQAFMHRPRLLILDEPTSGLDPLNQREFERMVAEVRSDGRTVFLSSHILSEVESVCDRVGIIRDGRLVRIGGVAELKDIRRHEVDLTFASEPAADVFRDLAGVERLEALPDHRTLRLIVQGDIDPIVKMAARYHLTTFVSHEPSLEDVFLRFESNKPLVSGYDVNVGALLMMAALTLALTEIGLVLFVRRDIGAPYVLLERFIPQKTRPRRTLPMQAWSLQSQMTRNASAVIRPALWWGAGLGAYALLLTAVLRQVQQNLSALIASLSQSNQMYADVIDRFTGGGNIAANMMFLNTVFTLLVVVVAAFAVSLANRWASDEEEGRLDLVLSTPGPRYRVMLTRFAACALGLTIVTGCIFSGAALASAVVGMQLDMKRLAEAAFSMLPVSLVVASNGYLLAGWLRTRAVTAILIALVLASFVLTLLAPLFDWPPAILELSIVEQYGAPLVDGLERGRVPGQLAVATAILAAAVVRVERKDLIR